MSETLVFGILLGCLDYYKCCHCKILRIFLVTPPLNPLCFFTTPSPPLKPHFFHDPPPLKTSCERSQIKEYLALTTSLSLPLHGLSFLITMWLNPFASGNYAEKHFLKLVKPFSDQCLAVKGKNCPNRSQVEHNFAAFCPRCNMHVLASKDRACWSLDMSNKTNSTLTSPFFFSPLLSLFCPVFSFARHLLRGFF